MTVLEELETTLDLKEPTNTMSNGKRIKEDMVNVQISQARKYFGVVDARESSVICQSCIVQFICNETIIISYFLFFFWQVCEVNHVSVHEHIY